MKKYLLYIFSIFCLAAGAFSSCQDDLIYNPENIGEGEADVTAEITFEAFTGVLSRAGEDAFTTASGGTDGNAISSINTLCVLLYNNDGVCQKEYWFEGDKLVTSNKKFENDEDLPSDYNSDKKGHLAESQTQQATVKLEKVPYGVYKMVAVANVPEGQLKAEDGNFLTLDEVQNLELEWNTNISANNQMFGYFSTDNSSSGYTPEKILISINRPTMLAKAWIKRVVSKVTVAFDGRKLKPGVEIYIKSVEIKDIPNTCFLGADNPATPSEEAGSEGTQIEFSSSEQVITYYNPETAAEGPCVTNQPGQSLLGYGGFQDVASNASDEMVKAKLELLHGETTPGFFFFENLQGEGEEGTASDKRQDVTGQNKEVSYPNGVIEGNAAWKDAKPYGSYIEVKAFYVHKNEAGKISTGEGSGDIVYRFMLGKDEITDYNAERNYHYKLTLQFNGYANDIDWHIDYERYYLDVTQLGTMNYQWQQFDPNPDIPNLGYKFYKTNVVTVTSYKTVKGDKTEPVPVVITYSECDENGVYGDYGNLPEWMTIEENDLSDPKEIKTNVTFGTEPNIVDIDANLKAASTPENTNLAANGSANCYIVSAPGTYTFPLVYGNALNSNRTTNTDAFECPGVYDLAPNEPTYPNRDDFKTEEEYKHKCDSIKQVYDNTVKTWTEMNERYLSKFKDYVNNPIAGPDIKAEEGYDITSAGLIWQDEPGLVSGVKLVGQTVSFDVEAANIKQGNAVIAIYDNHTPPRVVWSWHIWVTSFADLEETIAVTNKTAEEFGEQGWVVGNMLFGQTIDFMSMNLGWCSGGEKIKYYPGKKFKLKFTAGALSKEIDAELKSHIAFPLGNNPYYQWGRKDPFWGNNKTWYNDAGTSSTANPRRMFLDSYNNPANTELNDNTSAEFPEEARMTTVQIFEETGLNRSIQYPAIWHNPPRVQVEANSKKYISNNKTFPNLWGQKWDPWEDCFLKTVYDPCPPGYMVPNFVAYTPFTTTSQNVDDIASNLAMNVRKEDIASDNPKDNLFEFYTNREKLQSIIFPESGYRDWDDGAKVWSADDGKAVGYSWANGTPYPGCYANVPVLDGFLNKGEWDEIDNSTYYKDKAYNFEFSRFENKVRPFNAFVTCDGMPIRPCKNPLE